MTKEAPQDKKSAFTLPEVMVSISVILLVIFVSTNLVVSIIRSNKENVDTLVAYGLAQEGLEAIRNIRDSDWLLGANFKGEIVGTSSVVPWGDSMPDLTDGKKFFTVEANLETQNVFAGSAGEVKATDLVNYAPWILKNITATTSPSEQYYSDSTETRLYKISDSLGVHYGYDNADSNKETPFHRYVVIEASPYLNGGDKIFKIRVASVVGWTEQNRHKEVRLETILTDWKPNG